MHIKIYYLKYHVKGQDFLLVKLQNFNQRFAQGGGSW